MILRRFMQHVRKQDWFAVGLDVIVVIVGIFLGLQVQAWYEEQDERKREAFYLTQIHQELGQNIEALESSIKAYRSNQDLGIFLSQTIDHPELVTNNPVKFLVSLEVPAYRRLPNVTSNTFQELNFSGDRAIFQDKVLLSDLTAYYNEVEKSSRTLEQGLMAIVQRYFEQVAGILTDEQMRTINTLGPYSKEIHFNTEEAQAAYNRMMQRQDFINQIPRATNSGFAIRNYQTWKAGAEELRHRIGELVNLGQSN